MPRKGPSRWVPTGNPMGRPKGVPALPGQPRKSRGKDPDADAIPRPKRVPQAWCYIHRAAHPFAECKR